VSTLEPIVPAATVARIPGDEQLPVDLRGVEQIFGSGRRQHTHVELVLGAARTETSGNLRTEGPGVLIDDCECERRKLVVGLGTPPRQSAADASSNPTEMTGAGANSEPVVLRCELPAPRGLRARERLGIFGSGSSANTMSNPRVRGDSSLGTR